MKVSQIVLQKLHVGRLFIVLLSAFPGIEYLSICEKHYVGSQHSVQDCNASKILFDQVGFTWLFEVFITRDARLKSRCLVLIISRLLSRLAGVVKAEDICWLFSQAPDTLGVGRSFLYFEQHQVEVRVWMATQSDCKRIQVRAQTYPYVMRKCNRQCIHTMDMPSIERRACISSTNVANATTPKATVSHNGCIEKRLACCNRLSRHKGVQDSNFTHAALGHGRDYATCKTKASS